MAYEDLDHSQPAHLNQRRRTQADDEKLAAVMAEFGSSTAISGRDREFLESLLPRYQRFGCATGTTERQWAWIAAIYRKMFPAEAA